jgi:hypothetical protein
MRSITLFAILVGSIAAGPATKPEVTRDDVNRAAVEVDSASVAVANAREAATRQFEASTRGASLIKALADAEKARDQARANGSVEDRLDASNEMMEAKKKLTAEATAAAAADKDYIQLVAGLSAKQDRLAALKSAWDAQLAAMYRQRQEQFEKDAAWAKANPAAAKAKEAAERAKDAPQDRIAKAITDKKVVLGMTKEEINTVTKMHGVKRSEDVGGSATFEWGEVTRWDKLLYDDPDDQGPVYFKISVAFHDGKAVSIRKIGAHD